MQSTAALLIWAAVAVAVPAASAPTAPGAPAQATAATPAERGEPTVQRNVAEDDHVRIEEVRVRGESRSIVVKPKTAGAKEYEIEPSTGANDPSQRNRRAAGERVWRIFSF
jgi:hypothetical protein